MPNWCDNRITAVDREDFEKLKKLVKGVDHHGEEADVTFNVLVPMPPEIDRTSGGDPQDPMNWYNWSHTNWGTKWDACSGGIDEENMHVYFSTAWMAPMAWYEALAKAADECDIEALSVDLWYEGIPQEEAFDGLLLSDGKIIMNVPASPEFIEGYTEMYDEDEEE